MGITLKIISRAARGELLVAVLAVTLALIGSSISAVAQSDEPPAPVSLDELTAEGASIYRSRCTRCHGRNGEGERQSHDAAPRLAGNYARLSVQSIAVQVIRGGAYMPPFDSLTDREIAAVATYVRSSFGNDHGSATAEEVAKNR